jgi:dTDP-4-amino-4,6-dideoxygalactose transaminase
MVTTSSGAVAERLKMLRDHGSRVRYYYEIIGANSRLDEIQAAVLRIKLRMLPEWAEKRIKNAESYGRLFKSAGLSGIVRLPYVSHGNESVFNQYVVRVRKRDSLREHLKANGIGTEVYYPLCLHQQRCFRHLGYKKGDFPEAERAASEVLALPIYPELKYSQQEHVVRMIADFYRKGA